jgi:hypothetical protein
MPEMSWAPGPVESADPHDDPYGDLDLGPIPMNIVRNDGDGDGEDCARGFNATRGVVPGPMSRSRHGG